MSELKGRALMESRYGPLWSGGQVITVDGTEYDLDALTYHMGLNFEDSRAIDVSECLPGDMSSAITMGMTSALWPMSLTPVSAFSAKYARTSLSGSGMKRILSGSRLFESNALLICKRGARIPY